MYAFEANQYPVTELEPVRLSGARATQALAQALTGNVMYRILSTTRCRNVPAPGVRRGAYLISGGKIHDLGLASR